MPLQLSQKSASMHDCLKSSEVTNWILFSNGQCPAGLAFQQGKKHFFSLPLQLPLSFCTDLQVAEFPAQLLCYQAWPWTPCYTLRLQVLPHISLLQRLNRSHNLEATLSMSSGTVTLACNWVTGHWVPDVYNPLYNGSFILGKAWYFKKYEI